MPNDESSYEIGYGKPPKDGQFSKGKSGNPKGRPKGSKNLATVVLRESRQPVKITGPRGVRTITKIEATVMQVGNKAAQGDLRAAREFIPLVARAEEAAATQSSPLTVHELDQRVMESLRRRMADLKIESVVNQSTKSEDEKG